MAKFSIIIPHYNIPLLLEHLLTSIPDEKDIEVIVVDDRSNQDMGEYERVKNECSNRNIIFLKNETEKKGAGVCRNIGLKYATGQWVLFADADDLFADSFYRIMKENEFREEDIVFFFPTSQKTDTGETGSRHQDFCNFLDAYLQEPSLENELKLRFVLVAPWSKMIRKSMIEKNQIQFEASAVANDVLFCRQLGIHAKKIAVIPEMFYIVTERQGSLTTYMDQKNFEIRRDVYLRACKYVKANVSSDIYRKIHYTGGMFVHLCRVNKLGIMKLLETVFLFCKNGIKPIG